MSSLLQTIDLRREFSETGEKLEILKGVNFSMEEGELVALTGSSGSGKSTFLNLVGMLDTPTSGEILFKGKALTVSSICLVNSVAVNVSVWRLPVRS